MTGWVWHQAPCIFEVFPLLVSEDATTIRGKNQHQALEEGFPRSCLSPEFTFGSLSYC